VVSIDAVVERDAIGRLLADVGLSWAGARRAFNDLARIVGR
jgi:hypothetical protein